MGYQAGKAVTLMGKEFAPGDTIPEEVIADIPEGRLGSLIRLRLVNEKIGKMPKATAPPEAEPEAEPEELPEEPEAEPEAEPAEEEEA